MTIMKTPKIEMPTFDVRCLINGQRRTGSGDTTISVYNPFDNSQLAELVPATAQDINDAVEVAYRAFNMPSWRRMIGRERGKLLMRLAALLDRDAERFAIIESLDTGIPIRETRMEVATSVLHLEYFAGFAGKIEGVYQDLGPRFNFSIREPYGVIGQIVPWNTPLKLMARGFAAAIACGNAMVIKPSVVAPLSILEFGRLIEEAGFPPGIVNIVVGPGRTTGKALVEHPKVRKVIFTGGTEGGLEILHQAAATVTPTVLELGGKGPIVVCEDIDWDEAVDGVLTQAFARKAEVCFAGSRLFLPDNIHDRFVADLAGLANRIPLGNPLDDATQLGPLLTPERVDFVKSFVDEARRDGGEVVCGGGRPSTPELARGNFFTPTIVTGLTNDHKAAREEIFGPVLMVMRYSDLDDAVAQSNDSDFGLASYVWTNDLRKGHDLAQRIESGNVFINSYGYQSEIPFGGYRISGMGREHGSEAIKEYTQVKSVTVGMERFPSRFSL